MFRPSGRSLKKAMPASEVARTMPRLLDGTMADQRERHALAGEQEEEGAHIDDPQTDPAEDRGATEHGFGRWNDGPPEQPDEGSHGEGHGGKRQAVGIARHVRFRRKPTEAEINQAGAEEHDGRKRPVEVGAVVVGVNDGIVGVPSGLLASQTAGKARDGGRFWPCEGVGRIRRMKMDMGRTIDILVAMATTPARCWVHSPIFLNM